MRKPCTSRCCPESCLRLPYGVAAGSTSTVRGTVRDQSTAVVPGASLRLTNTATNVASETRTNEVGFYLFAGVLPGSTGWRSEAPGMQKFEGALTVQVRQDAVRRRRAEGRPDDDGGHCRER